MKLAGAEMYVQGVSTRRVAAVTEKLCGLEATIAQGSRAAALLDDELEKWSGRPLGETPATRRFATSARSSPVRSWWPSASITQGKRSVLGASVSLSEAEGHRSPIER